MSTLTINSNVASLSAQRRLAQSTKALESTFQRLSSGLRINRASDDAAGLAIASSISADRRVFNQGVRNFNDGVALLNVAEGAVDQLGNIITRIGELSEQAKNGTVTLIQRRALHQEAFALVKEFNRITHSTKYNDLTLLDGSMGTLGLQAGYGADGKISLVLADSVTSAQVTGTFRAEQAFDPAPYDVTTLGDVTGDGVSDVLGIDDANSTLSVLTGNFDGSFRAPVSVGLGYSPVSMETMDLNRDGAADLLLGDPSGTGFRTMFGNGNGTFRLGTSFSAVASNGTEVEDLNNDSIDDLVVFGNSAVGQVFFANGDGTFKEARTFSFELNGFSGEHNFCDLDADSNLDLVLLDQNTNQARVFYGNGNGTFTRSTIVTAPAGMDRIVVGDVDSDGLGDLVYAPPSPGDIKIMKGRIGRDFAPEATLISGTSLALPVLCDFNSDNLLDISYVDVSKNGEVYYRLGNGDGTFSATNTIYNSATGLQIGALFDVNGDGASDLYSVGLTDGILRLRMSETRTDSVLGYLNLLSGKNAGESLDATTELRDRVSLLRGAIGAFQARLGTGISNLQQSTENLATAESRIRDADISEESAALVRNQILQQAGVAVLAQANTLPELALTLLSRA